MLRGGGVAGRESLRHTVDYQPRLIAVAFMAIWAGLSKGPVKGRRGEHSEERRHRAKRHRGSPKLSARPRTA